MSGTGILRNTKDSTSTSSSAPAPSKKKRGSSNDGTNDTDSETIDGDTVTTYVEEDEDDDDHPSKAGWGLGLGLFACGANATCANETFMVEAFDDTTALEDDDHYDDSTYEHDRSTITGYYTSNTDAVVARNGGVLPCQLAVTNPCTAGMNQHNSTEEAKEKRIDLRRFHNDGDDRSEDSESSASSNSSYSGSDFSASTGRLSILEKLLF